VIREATSDDIPEVVEMGMAFANEGHYRGMFVATPQRMQAIAQSMVTSDGMAILVASDGHHLIGMVGIAIGDHAFSGEKIAGEQFWYVKPGSRNGVGQRLMRAAEQWARRQHATRLQMVAPDDRVGALYARKGYSRLEMTYQKDLI
jgi:GNAT superfamily N-acetyltransferase